MTKLVGPTTINCEQSCEVPASAIVTEVPPSRHNWDDVVACPNDGCERAFLVLKGLDAEKEKMGD